MKRSFSVANDHDVFFTQEKLKLVTVLGAGLLVGTALAVIIPEGVHTLYETQSGMSTYYIFEDF